MRAMVMAVLCAAFFVSSGCNSVSTSTSPAPLPQETTSSAPPAAPAPPPTPTQQPSLTGPEVVALVAARYPERLAGGISLEQRIANMEFLRDRIIETGTCGGLLLAWNRKSNGQRSIDAIDWRHGEQDVNDVVDLALGYDDTDRPLQLHWAVTHGPAGWDPYPAKSCS